MSGDAALACTDVRVNDLVRSVRFYRRLGLAVVARHRMADGTRIVWMRDPATRQVLELYRLDANAPLYEPFRPSGDPQSSLIFGVVDTDAIVPDLLRLGARPVAEFEQAGVRFVFLRDPNGKRLELLSWTHPRGRAPPLTHLGSGTAGATTRRRRGTSPTGRRRAHRSRRG